MNTLKKNMLTLLAYLKNIKVVILFAVILAMLNVMTVIAIISINRKYAANETYIDICSIEHQPANAITPTVSHTQVPIKQPQATEVVYTPIPLEKLLNLIEIEPIAEETHTFILNDIEVDIDKLLNLYYSNSKYGAVNSDDTALMTVCTDFLFNQMGFSAEITAAVVGNICDEGHFAQRQGTREIIDNLNDYLYYLSLDDGKGYGIAQWTYPNRQDKLVKYLNNAVDIVIDEYGATSDEYVCGEYYPAVVIIAELSLLYEELLDFELFEDYKAAYSIEDATGRIALHYEGYKNSSKHWKYKEDGLCYLVHTGDTNNGTRRLAFANHVYNSISE